MESNLAVFSKVGDGHALRFKNSISKYICMYMFVRHTDEQEDIKTFTAVFLQDKHISHWSTYHWHN